MYLRKIEHVLWGKTTTVPFLFLHIDSCSTLQLDTREKHLELD